MAVQNQLKACLPVTFLDKRRETAAGVATDGLGTPANYTDMTALDTRLTAIDATAYSEVNLRSMSYLDKLYALRVTDEADSI